MKQPIELRRLRDFGQIINDSFSFLRENFKPLFRALFAICGFFILLGVVTSVFAYLNISSVFTMRTDFGPNSSQFDAVGYFVSIFLNAFILALTQAFVYLATLCYISVYLQKGNKTPTLAEVWGYFKYYFLRVLGASILIFLLLMVGFLLCIIPGFYLMPVFYLIIPIIVIENSSFSYAFNKSFRLIKGNWWVVFGVIFIMGLIVSISESLANIPVSLITVGNKFLSLKSLTVPLLIFFSALRSLLLLLYVLPAIAVSLCYFNLAELKDGTGLLDRLEKLGKGDDDDSTLPAEEF